jgi:hypothetical protein
LPQLISGSCLIPDTCLLPSDPHKEKPLFDPSAIARCAEQGFSKSNDIAPKGNVVYFFFFFTTFFFAGFLTAFFFLAAIVTSLTRVELLHVVSSHAISQQHFADWFVSRPGSSLLIARRCTDATFFCVSRSQDALKHHVTREKRFARRIENGFFDSLT